MQQDALTQDLGTRSDTKRDEKQRRRRIIKLIIIILLLLLLLIGLLLAYILSFMTRTPAVRGIQPLFSLYGFDRPLAVTTDSEDNIYVSDTGHNRFYIYDPDGEFIRRIGADKGAKRFYGVIGADVDKKTRSIYVADWKLKAITIFSPKGKILKRFPKKPFAVRYGQLGFTPFGVELYKDKIYATSYNGIFVFSKEGKFQKRIGYRGRGDAQFDFPVALTVDKKDGTMYIADQLNRRVVAMSAKGKVKWTLGRPDEKGKSNSFFGLPRGITQGPNGHLYVSDTFHHTIVVLKKDGSLVSVLGERGVEDGKFNFPEGLVYASDRLYVADRENNRIQAIRVVGFPKPDNKSRKEHKASFSKAKTKTEAKKK